MITIFNRRTAGGETLWYPTVIEGVQLSVERAQAAAGYGWKQSGQTVALVPYVPMEGTMLVGGKIYLPPRMWRRVEEPELYVTFGGGEDFDFFLHGAWQEAGSLADGMWPGGLYGHLCRTRDEVFAVTGVHRYGALPHFEITGQ